MYILINKLTMAGLTDDYKTYIYVSRGNLPSWGLGAEETAHSLDNCQQPLNVRVIVN